MQKWCAKWCESLVGLVIMIKVEKYGSGGRGYVPLQAVVFMCLLEVVFQEMVRKRCAIHRHNAYMQNFYANKFS